MPKEFSGRSLSLLAAWTIAMYFVLIDLIFRGIDVTVLALMVFYINLPMSLYLVMLGLAVKRRRADEVKELFTIDAAWGGLAILLGAVSTFAVMLFLVALRSQLDPVPMETIILQAIVIVPSEEFSFRFFLPRILPGRLIGPPGWVWAQLTFAGLHFRAYDLDIFPIIFAFAFGVMLYLITDAGKRYRLLGLGFAIGVHFIWNLFALSTGAIIPI